MENEDSHTERKNRNNSCIQIISNIENVLKILLKKILYQVVKELEKNLPKIKHWRKKKVFFTFTKEILNGKFQFLCSERRNNL